MTNSIDIGGETFAQAVFELIRSTACDLPDDVRRALEQARENEEPDSTAALVLSIFHENLDMAKKTLKPACQDTGMPLFFVHHPENLSQRKMKNVFHDALARATQEQYLRPNAVHPVTGKNSGINVG